MFIAQELDDVIPYMSVTGTCDYYGVWKNPSLRCAHLVNVKAFDRSPCSEYRVLAVYA